ncbi:hypothetical protein DMB91_04520 [Campylobacter sp. MIT 97-5078]|nr:hypothetical protein LR59_13145 [Campylobacter sp. MIT 97-5078]KGI56801.1 hypothetical protein LR59_04770 [Campylobacter sp. MIT 97-5078]TQR27267.1 hypothetical protein DMB91_04520 [Campylobacter sp. MIT 97-5078]
MLNFQVYFTKYFKANLPYTRAKKLKKFAHYSSISFQKSAILGVFASQSSALTCFGAKNGTLFCVSCSFFLVLNFTYFFLRLHKKKSCLEKKFLYSGVK